MRFAGPLPTRVDLVVIGGGVIGMIAELGTGFRSDTP